MMNECLISLFFCSYICRSLQRTLNELKEYQKQHDHYLQQQEALDKYKLLQEKQILRNIMHETQMAKEAQLGMSRKREVECAFNLLYITWMFTTQSRLELPLIRLAELPLPIGTSLTTDVPY